MLLEAIGELSELSDEQLLAEMRALEETKRAVESRLATAIAVADSRGTYAGSHRSTKEMVRAHLNYSPAAAGRWCRLAATINRHASVGDAWLAGSIGIDQVTEFATLQHSRRLRPKLPEFVDLLVEHAAALDHPDFVECVDRFKLGADPDGTHDARDHAVDHRDARLTIVGAELAMTAMGGHPLTAQEMRSIFEHFCQREFDADREQRRAEHGDDAAGQPLARTAAQRRFDALCALFRAAAKHPERDKPVASFVTNIIIDDETFADLLAERGLTGGEPSMPTPEQVLARRCQTDDGQPLHPHDALRAVLAGHVRRVVVHNGSVVVNQGRLQRLFTGNARRAAKLLINRCGHAGCDLPARVCDVDHIEPWHADGATDQINAGPMCPGHNVVKESTGFRIVRDASGRRRTVTADGQMLLPVGQVAPQLAPPQSGRSQLAALGLPLFRYYLTPERQLAPEPSSVGAHPT